MSEPCRHEFRDSNRCALCNVSLQRLLLDERHEWRQTVVQLRADIARAQEELRGESERLRQVVDVNASNKLAYERDLARATAERDAYKRAAESQNRQWSAKCTELTETRAALEEMRARDRHVSAEVVRICGERAALGADADRLRKAWALHMLAVQGWTDCDVRDFAESDGVPPDVAALIREHAGKPLDEVRAALAPKGADSDG